MVTKFSVDTQLTNAVLFYTIKMKILRYENVGFCCRLRIFHFVCISIVDNSSDRMLKAIIKREREMRKVNIQGLG